MGDNLKAIDLGNGRHAIKIATGRDTICAILDNHDLKCWGYNVAGGLGLGDTTNRGDKAGDMGDNLTAIDLGTGRYAVDVQVGARFACAQLDD
eukprot:798686_1